MRIATYATVAVGLLIWGLPLAIYVAIMMRVYGHGATTIWNTIGIAWLFLRVEMVPVAGFVLTLAVPIVLRWLGYNRAALAGAVAALLAAVLVVIVPNMASPKPDTHQNKLGHHGAN